MKDRTNVGFSSKMRYLMAALMIFTVVDKIVASVLWKNFYEPFFTEITCVILVACALIILFGPWKNTDSAISIAGVGIGLDLILTYVDSLVSMRSGLAENVISFLFVADGIMIIYFAARFGMSYRRNGLRLAIFSAFPFVLYLAFTLYMFLYQKTSWDKLVNDFKFTPSIMALYLIYVLTIVSPNVKLPNSETKIRKHIETIKEPFFTDPDFYVTAGQAKEFEDAMNGKAEWEKTDGIFSEKYCLKLHRGSKIKTLVFRKYRDTGKIRVSAEGSGLNGIRFDYECFAFRGGDAKFDSLAIFGEGGIFVNVLVSKNPKEKFDENCLTRKQKLMKKMKSFGKRK